MYEFHGWASVAHTAGAREEKPQSRLWKRFTGMLGTALPEGGAHTAVRHDGSDHFSFSGAHPQREAYVLEVFQWLAENAPGAYGLLYVWDSDSDDGQQNAFSVWRLRRGKLVEHRDPFFSPRIPAVRDAAS
jgi:hypothetical protein